MAIVLVEGHSDRIALDVLARRLDIVTPVIIEIGGAHAAARVVADIHKATPQERIVGLADAGEKRAFAGVVDQVFICDRDLEDELIRALGIEAVLNIIDKQGELGSFGTLRKQPAQRERTIVDQMRRFLGGRSGNKARYAALFAEALDLDRIPKPIGAVLAVATEEKPRRADTCGS